MSFHNEIQSTTLEIQVGAAPSAASHYRFIADREYLVTSIKYRFTTGSTSGNFAIYKAPSGTALASGTALHGTAGDVSTGVTADTNVDVTLSTVAGALVIEKNDAIGVVWAGTLTNLVGCIIQIKLEAR